MTFGSIIKKLRRDAGFTQERLAELLSISPQAVSRWETDMAMPDISLLVPLANLFGVTTDYLLGMDTYQKDLRKTEFDEAFHEYWNHDDKEKNYQIAVRAAAEYPGNMEYMEWLASAEYYVAFMREDDAEYRRLLESSVSHYKIVIADSSDWKLHNKALYGIVLTLHMLGRNDEAKEYAMQYEDESKRDELLCWCLEGEEKIKHSQRVAERLLGQFLFQLSFIGKSLEVCNAVEQVLQILFPDGNYQYYHNTLQYNAIDKAIILCGQAQYDEAMAELWKARVHAQKMVEYSKETNYSFTAPLFRYVEGDKKETDSDVTDIDDFVRCLNNNHCFDPMRDSDEFKALLEA
ncbi:MAG: helix-turn-helix transcriptional regulator [Clostridiales bacterium]|nr:helix-turn-helix transcriptional regulator [Clostridiales bacterium]